MALEPVVLLPLLSRYHDMGNIILRTEDETLYLLCNKPQYATKKEEESMFEKNKKEKNEKEMHGVMQSTTPCIYLVYLSLIMVTTVCLRKLLSICFKGSSICRFVKICSLEQKILYVRMKLFFCFMPCMVLCMFFEF